LLPKIALPTSRLVPVLVCDSPGVYGRGSPSLGSLGKWLGAIALTAGYIKKDSALCGNRYLTTIIELELSSIAMYSNIFLATVSIH
jgi:hypothetical protein